MGEELAQRECIVSGCVGGDPQSLANNGNSPGLLTCRKSVPMRKLWIRLDKHRDH